MQKKILTQEDLDNNPSLVERGLAVGQEVVIPDEGVIADAQLATDEAAPAPEETPAEETPSEDEVDTDEDDGDDNEVEGAL